MVGSARRCGCGRHLARYATTTTPSRAGSPTSRAESPTAPLTAPRQGMNAALCPFAWCSGVDGLVLHDPALKSRIYPERVDADSDQGQQEPFDPLAEQSPCRTGETQAVTVQHRVFGLPPIGHHHSPRVADPECEHS